MLVHDPAVHLLGKLPPKRDHRDLKLAHYLTPELPPLPACANWGGLISRWELLGNDRYGDCTCAAVGHAVMAFTSFGDKPFVPTEAEVLYLYSTVTSEEGAAFDPTTGANDNGAYINDVLNEWRKSGFVGHGLGAYAAIDPANQNHLKAAIAFLGVVDIGVALPISAQGQEVWDVSDPHLRGDAAPGSWGGHSVVCTGYDSETGLYDIITWGQDKKCTALFLGAYMDEAFALLGDDWTNGDSPSPSGFNLDQLRADLSVIGSHAG